MKPGTSRMRAACLALLMLAAAGCSAGTGDAAPPNIILVMTDDQDTGTIPFMPRLSAAVQGNGVAFSRFFVNASVCCPSRASVLTGRYPHNHGLDTMKCPDNYFEFRRRGLESATIATLLHGAGYRTALVGKYVNGFADIEYIPPGWDEWYAMVGHNAYYNYTLGENGMPQFYGDAPEDYLTDVLAGHARRFVNRSLDAGRPFFLYLAPYAPHSPALPAPRHKDRFTIGDVVRFDAPWPPEVEGLVERDVSDKPAWVRNFAAANPKRKLSDKRTRRKRDWNRRRLQTLLAVDDMIGALLDQLRRRGALDNTWIFLMSDNGGGASGHFLGSAKITPYERGIRVPFVAIGPGAARGQVSDHLVQSIDLLPTFAEFAGVPVPAGADGRSLATLLRDPSAIPAGGWRSAVLVELGRLDRWVYESYPPKYQVMRLRDGKYIEYVTGEREFYDLSADPYELENRYGALDEATRKRLSERLSALARCAGQACRDIESLPDPLR